MQALTLAAAPWLDTLTTDKLQERIVLDDRLSTNLFGSILQRMIYHYWYHNGESMAIRQALGHADLQESVGDIDGAAPYRPE